MQDVPENSKTIKKNKVGAQKLGKIIKN